MGALIGGFVAMFMMALLVGYIFAGLTKLATKNPVAWMVAGAVGSAAPGAITLDRGSPVVWAAVLAAVLFFVLRYQKALKAYKTPGQVIAPKP